MSVDAVNSCLGGPETPLWPTLRDYDMFYPEIARVLFCVSIICTV